VKCRVLVTALVTLATATAWGAPATAPAGNPAALSNLGPIRQDDQRQWTVLMYMCADNNLEWALLQDVNTLEEAIPAKGVEIIVLVDRCKGFTDMDGDWTGARVYRIRPDKTKDTIKSELLADCGELNMGDPNVLKAFLTAGMKTFPAKRLAVFLNDHGAGWRDNCNDYDAPGMKDGDDELTLPETRAGLAGALAAVGRKRVDLLAFDMCLMGQLEVALACKDLCDVMVACQALGPNHGFPNEDYLAEFGTGKLSTQDLAKRRVKAFGDYYEKDGNPTATLSAIDCSKVDAVVAALNPLADKLAAAADKQWPLLCRSMFFAQTYMGRTDYRNGAFAISSFDLVDVIDRMRVNCGKQFPAEAEYQRLVKAVKGCVLAKYAGDQKRLSHGLSIHSPVRPVNLTPRYAKEAITANWAWLRFLNKVHGLQKAHAQKPTITNMKAVDAAGKATKVIRPLMGNVCTFDLEGKNILWLNVDFSKRLTDGAFGVLFKTFHVAPGMAQRAEDTASEDIDLLVPVYPDGKTSLGQELGGIMFQVYADGKIIPATVEMVDPGDVSHAIVRGRLSDKGFGTDVPVDIQFDVNTWTVDAVIAHMPKPGGGWTDSQIDVGPKATVKLFMETEKPGEPIKPLVTGTVTWGKKGPELVMTLAEPGQHYLFVRAESIAGLSSYGMLPYTIQPNQRLEAYLKGDEKLTPKKLLGKWRFQALVQNPQTRKPVFKNQNIHIQIKPDPDNAGAMLYEATIEGNAVQGIAKLDSRGVPLLSFYIKNQKGKWLRLKAYIALYEKLGGQPVVVLKDISVSEGDSDIQRMIRPGFTPFDKKKLIGTWQAADGSVKIEIGPAKYVYYEDGKLTDRGVWSLAGGKLIAKSNSGGTSTYPFTLKGDTLTIVEAGEKLVLTKQ